MPTITTNGISTNYLQIKCEAGDDCEDLVMVHGLGTNLSFWYLPHAMNFATRYRVTLFDLRGHGRSGMPPGGYTPRNLANDLRGLLDGLGIARAHFVAHSFGGVIALNLACQEPQRFIDLVLADTQISSVRRQHHKQAWPFGEILQPLFRQHGIDIDVNDPYFGFHLLGAVARLEAANVTLSPELTRLLGPLVGKSSKRTARQWLWLLNTTAAESELMSDDGLSQNKLRKLKFPILAMYGERSRGLYFGKQQEKIWHHASFCGLAEAGHFFPLTHADLFMQKCFQFWQEAGAAHPLYPPVVANQ